jgi:hypothetical protein
MSISKYDACDCHYQRECKHDDAKWCLATISIEDVIAAVDERLRRASGGAGGVVGTHR